MDSIICYSKDGASILDLPEALDQWMAESFEKTPMIEVGYSRYKIEFYAPLKLGSKRYAWLLVASIGYDLKMEYVVKDVLGMHLCLKEILPLVRDAGAIEFLGDAERAAEGDESSEPSNVFRKINSIAETLEHICSNMPA